MHHHTKFGYKRFSSWGGIVQINIHWNFECFLWPWPWSQQRNPIFLEANPAYNGMPQKSSLVLFNHRELHQGCFLKHNLAHDDISPYQVIAVKGSAVQQFSSSKDIRYDWCASLSHPSSCMLVSHGPPQQSSKEEHKPWKRSLTFWSSAVTLTLNPASQFFRKTLWIMIMYHQIKFW